MATIGIEYPASVADKFIRFGNRAMYHIDEQALADSIEEPLEEVQRDRLKTWTTHLTTETQLYHKWLTRRDISRDRLATINFKLHDLVGEAPGAWNLITASPWGEPCVFEVEGVTHFRQKTVKMPNDFQEAGPHILTNFLNFDLDFNADSGYVRSISEKETYEISWEKDGDTILMTDFDGNMVRVNWDRTVHEIFASPADLVFTKYKHELGQLKDANEYKHWNESMFAAASRVGLPHLDPSLNGVDKGYRLPKTLLGFRNTDMVSHSMH
tara:strand:- start:4162 stop:4968 length:807 start_codon:yes stop_codon:yes gene_type:complete